MRVVVADDVILVRRGVMSLLIESGVEVVGEAGDVKELIDVVVRTNPDVAIVDIRMPPTHTDEGVRAAAQLKRMKPSLGVLLLSQHIDVNLALRILDKDAGGLGYLLKDRVSDAAELVRALYRLKAQETVIDTLMVQSLVDSIDRATRVDQLLSFRELRVLSLLAEGFTDRAIAETLLLSGKTVEAHISRIFRKLGLEPSANLNRRVHAVLRYLRECERGHTD